MGDVEEKSIAANAGFEYGDEIIFIDNKRTATWNSVIDSLITKVIDAKTIEIVLRKKHGVESSVYMDMSAISIDEMAEGDLLTRLGVDVLRPVLPAVIDTILDSGGCGKRWSLKYGQDTFNRWRQN